MGAHCAPDAPVPADGQCVQPRNDAIWLARPCKLHDIPCSPARSKALPAHLCQCRAALLAIHKNGITIALPGRRAQHLEPHGYGAIVMAKLTKALALTKLARACMRRTDMRRAAHGTAPTASFMHARLQACTYAHTEWQATHTHGCLQTNSCTSHSQQAYMHVHGCIRMWACITMSKADADDEPTKTAW